MFSLLSGIRTGCPWRNSRKCPAGSTIESDLLDRPPPFPKDVAVAYYLVHSMGSGGDFAKREEKVARNFAAAIEERIAGRSFSSAGCCRGPSLTAFAIST